MSNRIKPNQQRLVVELDANLARRLEAFRLRRGKGGSRISIIRKAIEEHITSRPKPQPITQGVVLPEDTRQDLETFCREGDGAVAEKVIANALRMYLPYRQWGLQAEHHPEVLSPMIRNELGPELAGQAARFCARTRVPAKWFLEEALLQHIAAGERDQWQRFIFRAPGGVAAQIATLKERTGLDPKTLVERAIDFYVAARVSSEPELKRRLELLREENAAQLSLFHAKERVRS